jgi:hypothetical protein
MAGLEFTRKEIEQLAQKLSSPEPRLSGRDRTLLLAIFSAASAHVTSRHRPESRSQAAPALADLKDQIVTAFIPGQDERYELAIPRIGFPPISPPPRTGGTPPPGPPEPPVPPEPAPAPPEPAPVPPEPAPTPPEPAPGDPPSPPVQE